MRVSIDQESTKLDQSAYIKEILIKFNMENCKIAKSPSQPGYCLSASMSPKEMASVPYRELVGALNWLATSTRSDIAHAVSCLSRFLNNPGRKHWTAAKRVVRYLKGTSSEGLGFHTNDDKSSTLVGYSDSDWAGDVDSRRSTSGYIFLLAGSAISWKSRLQPITACSSTEAEYIALSEATKQAVWLRNLLGELGVLQNGPTIIYEDNQGCISISQNRRSDKRTKHIDIRFHYTRDQIEAERISVKYCTSHSMQADVLTKEPNAPRLTETKGLIGLQSSLDSLLRGGVEGNCNNDSCSGIDAAFQQLRLGVHQYMKSR
jgi:hypothetical protein